MSDLKQKQMNKNNKHRCSKCSNMATWFYDTDKKCRHYFCDNCVMPLHNDCIHSPEGFEHEIQSECYIDRNLIEEAEKRSSKKHPVDVSILNGIDELIKKYPYDSIPYNHFMRKVYDIVRPLAHIDFFRHDKNALSFYNSFRSICHGLKRKTFITFILK